MWTTWLSATLNITFCLLPHEEFYGDVLRVESNIGSYQDCAELCLDDCAYFAYRELYKKCYLMSDLDGFTHKEAFKVTSGFRLESENCNQGGERYDLLKQTHECWYDSNLFKCAKVTTTTGKYWESKEIRDKIGPSKGCTINHPKSDRDCICSNNRFLTSPYVIAKVTDGYCDISEELSKCKGYQTHGAVGMFQVYSDLAKRLTGCQWPFPKLPVQNLELPPYEYYRGQFFSVSAIARPWMSGKGQARELNDPLTDGYWPTEAIYCNCFVTYARDRILPEQCMQ